jgi:hypothetical protein
MASKHGAVEMIVILPFPWPYRMSMEAGNVNIENRFVKQQVPAICLSAFDGLTLMHHIGQGKIKEEGCSPGMAQYVQIHKDRTNKVKAAINLDMFGTGGRFQLVESGKWHDTDTFEFSHWLIEALETAADDMGYHIGLYKASSTSDETRFLLAGVPSVWFWKPDDVYYHSITDTPEMVDANSLKALSDITAVAVMRIANLETLP